MAEALENLRTWNRKGVNWCWRQTQPVVILLLQLCWWDTAQTNLPSQLPQSFSVDPFTQRAPLRTLLLFPQNRWGDKVREKLGGKMMAERVRYSCLKNIFPKVPYTWLEEDHKSGSKISVSLHCLLPWSHIKKVKPFLWHAESRKTDPGLSERLWGVVISLLCVLGPRFLNWASAGTIL